MQQNPEERLGCHPQTGFADIQSHLFFRAINWKQVLTVFHSGINIFILILEKLFFLQLQARQVCPPFKPRVEEGQEVENFDPQFTEEPVVLTPDDP